MNIVIIGPPGAGKGTQAQLLADVLKCQHINTGDLLRREIARKSAFGEAVKEALDTGGFAPNRITNALIRHEIATNQKFVLDGFPRNVDQARELTKILSECDRTVSHVINIVCDDEILVSRLMSRNRDDDKEDIIRRRLELFNSETKPVIEYYRYSGIVRTIDGNGSILEVFDLLKTAVGLNEVNKR